MYPRRSADITELVRAAEYMHGSLALGIEIHKKMEEQLSDCTHNANECCPDCCEECFENEYCVGYLSGEDGGISLYAEPMLEGDTCYSIQIEEDHVQEDGSRDVATVGMTRTQIIALALELLAAVGVETKGVSF